ncbi:MAG: TonB-dependent siderophore receptor, partial [Nitrosomonas sp.]|nr:TonB-dependent siderophore receptor [Nitrosomonas sp.]
MIKIRNTIEMAGLAVLMSLVCMLYPFQSGMAESSVSAASTTKSYTIDAGPLSDALAQFAKQSGVKLTFDPALLQGKMSFGLTGDFEIKQALDQLLENFDFQIAQSGEGYVITATATTTATVTEAEQIVTLPSIQITANTTSRYAVTSTTTATKTNTLLRDTPQAITVITGNLIKDQSIRSIADAARYVPGVGVSQGEGNRDALVFRGNRSTGDFFIDGLRDDAEFFRDLYNIERIEVLKGANGMIFGRGGSGGVVNRVTKEAHWSPVQEFSFQGGSFSQKRMSADTSYVINDIAAVRLNALYEEAGSFRNGVDMERLGISPTVTIKPTRRTKVVVNMERFHDDRTADRGITSVVGSAGQVTGPVSVKRAQFFGDPQRSNAEIDALSFGAFIEHKFASGIAVQNRTNYTTYDKFYENVFAGGGLNLLTGMLPVSAYNNTTERDNVFNQTNLLYSLNTGPISHTLLAGIEIGRQETHNRRNTGTFDNNAGSTIMFVPIGNPITNAPITFRNRDTNDGVIDALNQTVVDVTSLYIQDQIEIIPQLQLIAGVRYDLFEVDFQQKNGPMNHIKTRDDLISPRFGVIYKPFEPVSFYASYSRAFVPRAGDQLTALNVTVETLKPEKFTTKEIGVKWDIRPDLAITGAAYRLDRTNAINSIVGGETFLSKGQRTEGVEVSLAGQLTQNWSVMGGYAYQTGEITDDIFGVAKKGAAVAELPRHTFSMWSRYDITPSIGAAVGVIHRDNMF